VLVAVTDHAAERFRQRVRGTLDARTEVAARVGRAWAAGDYTREPPPGAAAQRGSVYVREGDIVYVCLEDKPRGELVVVTLWRGNSRSAGGRLPAGRVPRDDTVSRTPSTGTDTGGNLRHMGFMDKAKKMAEQAQAKLDDAQKQFNSGQQSGMSAGAPAVEYDKHGRPIASEAPPAAPPHGDPLAGGSQAPPAPATPGVPPTDPGAPVEATAPSPPPVAQPAVPPTGSAPPPAADAPAPQAPPARPESDAADEDRNHPSYAPPKLSSGDPLAG
jgi:hypothetical protein